MIITWRTHKTLMAVAAASFLAALAIPQNAQAQGSCCSSKSSKPDAAGAADCHSDTGTVTQRTDSAWVPPHGGQIHKSIWNYFEVVYGPQESRIYVYDIFHNPVAARGIQGQVFMRVRSNGGEYHYPLHYMAARDGRDSLAFHVDLTHVRDGDMDVQLDLVNMPNPEERTVRFTQVFAIHPSMRPAMNAIAAGRENPSGSERTQERPPAVALADATTLDQSAIDRQGVCPLTGTSLGEHGTPIKVSLNGRSLFVCCRGCIDKVLQQPDAYFQKVARAGSPSM